MATSFQIIGFKKSGKTAVTEEVTQILTQRGFNVSVFKHDRHRATMDKAGTDTDRFTNAGAENVILQSDSGLFLHRTASSPLDLTQIIQWLGREADLVLIEGYKMASFKKLVLLRPSDHRSDFMTVSNIVRFASLQDHPEADLVGQTAIVDWLINTLTKGENDD
ncbi:molybdopterin-guanine dinucleotide biosynthesis protein B [Secundilactobacillus kimchicus]|uniref:molybdopterin-guanine dinucleotide biosynthesis protein B n=1 Tax=Secundilactobacillus kimchicus TaxID=528209 RepID=UPI0024A85D57|nr:molybdopterin-guanine dinucleotide biosynthesis protein B [Secundilactobacillus kimchicus]